MKKKSYKFNIQKGSAGSTQSMNGSANIVVLRVILLSFAMLGFLYIFLMGNMVFNIVERKSLEADARELASEVRDLELKYLSMSNNVDLALAYSLGFMETEASFISRAGLGFRSGSTLPLDTNVVSQNGI